MKYVEALNTYDQLADDISLFTAGGITGCPDWQQELVQLLSDTSYIVFNPRRKDFPIHDPGASREQIAWEFEHLHKADIISFWFAKETIQPIALFELGSWLKTSKPIFIGCHPEYPRIRDVFMQTELVRPHLIIVNRLKQLAYQLIAFSHNY
jgi:hypothetical protein